jgi:flagellar protein FliO/FliZ
MHLEPRRDPSGSPRLHLVPFRFSQRLLIIAALGFFLAAASAAIAADRPATPAGEPWWLNPPSGAPPDSATKPVEYAPATAGRPAPKAGDVTPPPHADQVAEFAPDPPGMRHSDAQPVVFQQEPAGKSETPAEKPKAAEPARGSAVKPLLPPSELSTAVPAARPATPAPTTATPPSATVHAPSTAPGEPIVALGLGAHGDKSATGKGSPLSAMITVGGSLAIVLGLFFIVAWAMRKTGPRGSLMLPKEVFDILGRAPLGARQQVQLLRCGSKLLLVSITPSGTETLTEVTDPLEVDRIAGICQQAHPKSATMAFRQVFQQMAPKSVAATELDNLEPAGTRRKRYRWEEKHA